MAYIERPDQRGTDDGQSAIAEAPPPAPQGRREMLLRQLRRRFGDLPESVVARIAAADGATLGVWGERVITARSLDEVLRR